jgi:hypothetical protein
MQTGTALPTGYYSSVATGPYDQKAYPTNMYWEQKSGFSNDNALQATYQRLFHRGIANLGSFTSPYGTLGTYVLPPARPQGIASYSSWRGLDRYQNYHFDSAIPLQHITFNGIVDLPFGRGKRFLGNSGRFLDRLVGGFQLAGDGSIFSTDFQPASGNWGPTNPFQTYKHNAPITDCRSGVCHKSFEWFNGYVAPTANATVDCSNGKCVSGLPSNWAPYATPIDNTPGTTNYGNNNVLVTLANGTSSTIPFSPGQQGANPFSNKFLMGPYNYTIDLSVFKVLPITERVNLRINVDAFNALNMQGYNLPNTTDGTESLLTSYNTPRQLQFTMRLSF